MNSITGPKLLPHSPHITCAACGANTPPLLRLRQILFGGISFHMNHQLCCGGKEPTEDGHIATLVGKIPVQRQWNCAGIGVAHLHNTCRNCGYQFLTHTRTRGVE